MLNTTDNLQELIINCIDSAIDDREIPTDGPFQDALESQEHIGWLGMIRAYCSKEWQKAFERTYPTPTNETRKHKNKRQLQMQRWQTKLVHSTWTEMIKLWKLSNNERHGIDIESRELARHGVLHHELEEIYSRREQYPDRVQRLLRASYEIHIQETVNEITDWLDAYKGTFAITWSPD
jgi:hypothetical protein